MSTDAVGANAELERLRECVKALEAELSEVQAWADRVIAEAQARTYWLDRWGLDLNELMRRRGADRTRAFARAVRAVYRAVLRTKWRYVP